MEVDLPLSIVLVILENVHKYLAIDLLTIIDQYLFMSPNAQSTVYFST